MTPPLLDTHRAAPRPSPSPECRWAGFAAFLDQRTLNTALLQRWLGGAEVYISRLTTTGTPEQQRELTLVARVGGRVVPVCHARSRVRLDRLPTWASTVLTSTQLPLGHTLSRIGAVRDRTAPIVLPPSPDPADSGFTVNGTFRLAGRTIAEVSESFTGHVLEHTAPMTPHASAAVRAADMLDGLDVELVDLLRRRDAAQQAAAGAHAGTPPVYTTHDTLLHAQLRGTFGADRGGALSRAIVDGGPRTAAIAAATARRAEARA